MLYLLRITNDNGLDRPLFRQIVPFLDVNLHHKEMLRLLPSGMSEVDYQRLCNDIGATRHTSILSIKYNLTHKQGSAVLRKAGEFVDKLTFPLEMHRSFLCANYVLKTFGGSYTRSLSVFNNAIEWANTYFLRNRRCMWCLEFHSDHNSVWRCWCGRSYCMNCGSFKMAVMGWAITCETCVERLAVRVVPMVLELLASNRDAAAALESENTRLRAEIDHLRHNR